MEFSRIQGLPQPNLEGLHTPKRGGTDAKAFGGVLQDAIVEVERMHTQADQKVQSIMSGDGEDLHSAMLAVEKASLSFELMMQVRNKVVSAYQEISRLQF